MTQRPVICCLERVPTHADAHRLTPGSRVADVVDDLAGPPGTVAGVVSEDDVSRAVGAAQRGWHLIVQLDLRGERRRLALEDLARIGHLCDEAALDGPPFLGIIDAGLLHHLAAGANVHDAATRVGMSERTAARRLAILRDALGVATNSGLIVRCRR